MPIWFGVTFFDIKLWEVMDQQVHGPYLDTDALEDAIKEKMNEALEQSEALEQNDVIALPIRFELCTDDVPELVN